MTKYFYEEFESDFAGNTGTFRYGWSGIMLSFGEFLAEDPSVFSARNSSFTSIKQQFHRHETKIFPEENRCSLQGNDMI